MTSSWDAYLSEARLLDATSTGNRVEHLRDDDDALRRVWAHIEAARRSVWMSMYTLVPDDVGRGTIRRLVEAAGRGCDVRLIYDHMGSMNLAARHLAPLKAAGGRVAAFNRFWPLSRSEGSWLIRNHRKITIIDHEVAFCGGQNLSEAYAGWRFGSWTFDDTSVRVEGPCVQDVARVVLRTWYELTGEKRPLPPRAEARAGGVPVEVLETDPRRAQTQLRRRLEAIIEEAAQCCYVTTPYFIPGDWLVRALSSAARGGADVRVLTNGKKNDVPVTRAAGRARYGALLESGVRLFEMFDRVVHSKTVMIDRAFSVIGSFNMDVWTSRHVLDLAAGIRDAGMALSLEAEFRENLRHAHEVEQEAHVRRAPWRQAVQRVAFQASRVL